MNEGNLIKITDLLSEFLRPQGFKKVRGNFLRNEPGILTRVSYYNSQFDRDVGYIDITLTFTPVFLEKQSQGDYHLLERLERLLPSGDRLENLIKPALNPEEAALFRKIFEKEAVELINSLTRIDTLSSILTLPSKWIWQKGAKEGFEIYLRQHGGV